LDFVFSSKPNVNEFVHFSAIDTPDWKINPKDNRELICQNPGIWYLCSQYQVTGLKNVDNNVLPKPSLIGWFNLNNIDLENTAAISNEREIGGTNVLTICYLENFKIGDIIKCGLYSISPNNNIYMGITQEITRNNLNCPSFIFTAQLSYSNIL